jgi:hypothetical protein
MPEGYPPAPVGTNGFAVAGFVLSLLAVVPLGVIFSIIGLVKARSSGQRGRGLAIAGLVISTLWGLLFVVGIAAYVSGRADRDASGAVVSPGRVNVSSLKVGDCIQLPGDSATSVIDVTGVPCATPHDGEVYVLAQLTSTGDYPGDGQVQNDAAAKCQAAFEPFVGKAFDDSTLGFTFIYPQKQEWGRGGRTVTCIVTADHAQTTGSLKGSAK